MALTKDEWVKLGLVLERGIAVFVGGIHPGRGSTGRGSRVCSWNWKRASVGGMQNPKGQRGVE